MMKLRAFVQRFLPSALQPTLRSFASSLHSANWRHRCSVCEQKVERFLPLDPYYEEQWRRHGYQPVAERDETCNLEAYSCPFCGSPDRDRLSALYLHERLGRNTGGPKISLVDFAPAPALSAHVRRNYHITYRTADLNMPGVDDHVDLACMDLYADRSFDAFICSHVLEHVSDDLRAMAELHRILKPGGWGLAMVPIPLGDHGIREDPSQTSEADRWRSFGQSDHVRIYSRTAFVSRLESVGFEVRALDRRHFGSHRLHFYGIADTAVLYVAEKVK